MFKNEIVSAHLLNFAYSFSFLRLRCVRYLSIIQSNMNPGFEDANSNNLTFVDYSVIGEYYNTSKVRWGKGIFGVSTSCIN